jgi:SAM-dependent methyltransferase
MSKEFWESRWQNHQTGWDLGHVSSPLKAYIDQLEDKTLCILIPGCGNAYEAEYLFKQGFENVFIAEIAQHAIDAFTERFPLFPSSNIYHGDFFELDQHFDLVLEQTFFCAIVPDMRQRYVEKMSEILAPSGKLVGVLFNRTFSSGPPFGGSVSEYEALFSSFFNFIKLEKCYNSEIPRQGSEVFIILQSK